MHDVRLVEFSGGDEFYVDNRCSVGGEQRLHRSRERCRA